MCADVICEAGATHFGFESSKEIIAACAEAGAYAVKFQSIFADDLLRPESKLMVKFITEEGEQEESVYEALKRRELSWDQWAQLCDYAKSLNLFFISTPSSFEGFLRLAEMGADWIKIAKGDQNYRYLLEQIAGAYHYVGSCSFILDGRENISELITASRILDKSADQIAIMHCPSGYPAPEAGVHLSAIPLLRQIFPGYEIGYADHSIGTHLCFTAIGLGATMIEKTVTQDKKRKHAEHYMSLELGEIAPFVEQVRQVYQAMGSHTVLFTGRVNPEARRGIYAARNIRKGETIFIHDLAFRRPQGRIPVDRYTEIVGTVAGRDIEEGEEIW